ncbi:helix-turn-helix domain-containing GNAT family N-acetyltransferase [Shimia abyssi]|uniref:MarR family transcriptional regulator with acetyltransferase activity n=1 Tax=Shimia abyssi TaxID=1662395 RepID=A0A2P8F8U6_9RHOB|nr:helix-turn-helix domain-containing GNAT family N-acetyltransferase [Shimia abyssi]PSL18125.1 MarR family transcriptional regulator with acetyltransferase activity [Shimia abyssi]
MTFDPILRVRRFNRAITRETGALNQSFLGRGRALGLARVIHAIGTVGQDLERIREYLGLDKTLLSRYLRTLSDEGLLIVQQDAKDGRRRKATLTRYGEIEFEAYEKLSEDSARGMLLRCPEPEELLNAMDTIANALTHESLTILQISSAADDALNCLQAYYSELSERLDTGFDVNLSADPDAADLTPPRGSFLVAYLDGLPVGCVGVKGTDKGYGEIKRLWVSKTARGLGLAKRLMDKAEKEARALGMKTLRLDTNSALPEAVKLYRSTGWQEIDRFNDDPYPDVFFEKHL